MREKVLADRYTLVEQIGVGGMAIVYRAIDQRTGHSVAVKVLRPDLAQDTDYVSRFQREAEAAAKMTHHNIVNLLDVGMDGENRYLVMEYVQGKTLKQVIQERGRISPDVAAQITIRILSALQHAHSNGIIHRDIKPQNILVNADGLIKVADFGIARMADSSTITRGDIVMGSVHYFSPEQASGASVDARSDIYSVGVTLYEMLTGRVPFDGDTQVAIAMQHIHSQPQPIESIAPEVPASIIHVCMVAMSKDPKYRYQSARDMAADLRMAIDGRADMMQSRTMEAMPPMGPETTGMQPIPEMAQTMAQPSGNTKSAGAKPGTTGRNAKIRKARRKRRKINYIWWAATLLVAAGVFYGIWAGGNAIYERVVNSTEVPDFVDMELSAAEKAAAKAGLNLTCVEVNTDYPYGTVVQQAPAEGMTLKKGATVVLTVSMGPSTKTVPSVVGLTTNDAIAAAKASDLVLTVIERVVSVDVQEGFVLSQAPEAGTLVTSDVNLLQVTVSGGASTVPNTVGELLEDAQEMMAAGGLSVSANVQYVSTEDTSLHGRVAAQSVEAGKTVMQQTPVSLTVYQVPSLMHSAEVVLDLQQSDTLSAVRVTMVIADSEVTVFTGEYPVDASRHPKVTLTTFQGGTYTYRVYINDEFKYQSEVRID